MAARTEGMGFQTGGGVSTPATSLHEWNRQLDEGAGRLGCSEEDVQVRSGGPSACGGGEDRRRCVR